MIDFILYVLVAGLFCNGVYFLFDEGSPLHFLQKILLDHAKRVHEWRENECTRVDQRCKDIKERARRYSMIQHEAKAQLRYQVIFKPILLCLPCMASVWGTMALIVLSNGDWSWWLYVIGAIAVIPVNLIIFKIWDNV